MESIEQSFRNALLEAVAECRRVGYNPSLFVRMIHTQGPFEAVRSLLLASDLSDGFKRLWEKSRLDLTVEAIVLKPEWRGYFTNELNGARDRLAQVGYRAPWDDSATPVAAEKVLPVAPVHTVLPPVANSESLLDRIRLLPGQPERNNEDAVKDLLMALGFEARSIVFQRGRIDISILGQTGKPVMVIEVKRSIAPESERSAARRQGIDYACQTGAPIVIITDGDRYEVYDRRKGCDYQAMLRGAFRLTAFREEDKETLDLLRPKSLLSM